MASTVPLSINDWESPSVQARGKTHCRGLESGHPAGNSATDATAAYILQVDQLPGLTVMLAIYHTGAC